MHRFSSSSKFVLLLVAVASVVGIGAYLASQVVPASAPQTFTVSIAISPLPPLVTPIEPYANIDPAIVPYLQRGQPQYGVIPLELLGADLPPVGAYLPRSGNTQFELQAPTLPPAPYPTPIIVTLAPVTRPPRPPYPTSPPPVQPTPVNELVLTVLAFATNYSPPALPYAGGECGPAGLPVDGSILTQRFSAYHSGIDLSVPLGTPVRATHSGVVTWADWNTFGYGNLVIVQSARFITYYAHLTSFNVKLGDVVGKGTFIAWSGSTGNSSGPHVHYETRIDDVPVDPQTFELRGYGTC